MRANFTKLYDSEGNLIKESSPNLINVYEYGNKKSLSLRTNSSQKILRILHHFGISHGSPIPIESANLPSSEFSNLDTSFWI